MVKTAHSSPKTDPFGSRSALFWGLGALLLFALFFIRTWNAGENDFTAYFNAGLRASAGVSPYLPEATPYRYLPFTAFFFTPFSLFPIEIARLIFFTLNFAAVIAIYFEIRKRVGDFATVLIAALCFRFHNHDFMNSQINPLLLVLFFYWWQSRLKNLAFSTLSFSIFGSFKVLPFALGLPLLLRGKWREIQWIVLWTVVIGFVPVLFYVKGPLVFHDWYEQARVIDNPAMLSNVQALQSALWWIIEGHLSPKFFQIVMILIQVILFSLIFILAPKRNRDDWIFTSTLALTVLISPLAWKHSYLNFLPLFFQWFREDPTFRERRTHVLYGTALLGLVVLPSLIATWDREFSNRLYLMPYTGIILVIGGLILARRADQMLPIEK